MAPVLHNERPIDKPSGFKAGWSRQGVRRRGVLICSDDQESRVVREVARCSGRLLLNGLIQPFQQPARVISFFNTYRQHYPVSRDVLRDIANQFQNWVVNRSQEWDAGLHEEF